MAIWIDDTLTEQDRWLDLSPTARAALIEIWAYCKRSRNNGILPIPRIKRGSDAYDDVVGKELEDQRWLHRDATGCGTETCPKGIPGFFVVHDFLQHQESATDMSSRIDASREKSRYANHKRWHEDRGVVKEGCTFCLTEGRK